jgi:DNA-binding IclR family transcriptional regulator
MAKGLWEVPINDKTAEEDLHRLVLEAAHSGDPDIVKAGARARAELALREREDWITKFNAEGEARDKSQQFQTAQLEKYIEVARKQAWSAQDAKRTAWVAAVAAIFVALAAIAVAAVAILDYIERTGGGAG